MYPVNVEALNTVFSPYGFVQKIAIFEKNGQTQVRLPSAFLSHTLFSCISTLGTEMWQLAVLYDVL